ncbi:MAG TPA: hypothetical protein VKW06_12940 [Candidatus Angelobacter sp.]|nr:hypothetical protein [Candidatus Angelobacter sp.]
MARWKSLKDTLLLAVTTWRLWLLHFVANAVFFLLFIWWLRPHEASGWQLFYSSLVILLTAAATLVLHAGTLDFFQIAHQRKESNMPAAFRRAWRHLPAIAVWALVFFFLQMLLGKLDQYSVTLPGFLRSEFPAWLRRMISEPRLDSMYSGLLWLLHWLILPALLLPLALFSADRGFRGLIAVRDCWRTLRSLVYWIVLLVAALIGVSATQAIMGWKLDPRTATLSAEETSLVFRLLFAYLLRIFSWLLACSALGRNTADTAGESAAQPV